MFQIAPDQRADTKESRGNMMPIRRIPSLLFGSLFFAVVVMVLALPATSFAQIGVSITIGPPALPVYEQPPCPAEGYIWTPGYWAYGEDGYYWVPGTWVLAPEPGFLWTPGWWGWGGGVFLFHEGYWGPHVGFYGGIVYGFGYFGEGYEGGRWDHGRFFYNQSVNNVNVTNIHNVYNTTVINNNTTVINNNTTVNRVSYNGGEGGINARPRPEDEVAARERHISPVAEQTRHVEAARANPELRASANHGRPPIAATPKPGAFRDRAVVPAKEAGAPYKPAANRGQEEQRGNPQAGRPQNNVPRPGNNEQAGRPNNVPRPPIPTHAKDLQPHERLAPPNTGNPKRDQKYQAQQEKLYQRQEQDHQKLQQKQEQEHQRLAQRNADEARKQQVEQKHQQQTQRMEQRHENQIQKLQNKQRPR
jgi:hypothetical protein